MLKNHSVLCISYSSVKTLTRISADPRLRPLLHRKPHVGSQLKVMDPLGTHSSALFSGRLRVYTHACYM